MCTHILLIIVNCIALYLASPPPLRCRSAVLSGRTCESIYLHSIRPIQCACMHSGMCTIMNISRPTGQPRPEPTASQYPLRRAKCIFFICVIGDECDRYDYCTCNGYTQHTSMDEQRVIGVLFDCLFTIKSLRNTTVSLYFYHLAPFPGPT